MLNAKRLSLTVFSMVLTFSIGLVSVNLPLSSYAQNSALVRDGNSIALQQTGQMQSSQQESQVISGDASVLSGNNLLCQNQDSSQVSRLSSGICNSGQVNPPSNVPTAKLIVNATVNDGQCTVAKTCSITITYGSKLITQSVTHSMLFDIDVPVDSRFAITVTSFGPLTATITNSDCQIFSTEPYFQCRGTKNSQPTQLNTIFFSR